MQISGMSASYTQMTGMSQGGRQKPSFEEKFGQVDSDGNGGITMEEFSADITAMQENMGQDGKVPPNGQKPPEMTQEQMEEMFAEADSDGDGVLSSDEYKAHLESMRPDPAVMQQMAGSVNEAESTTDSTSTLISMLDSSEEDEAAASSYLTQLVQQSYGLSSSGTTSSSTQSSLLNVSA